VPRSRVWVLSALFAAALLYGALAIRVGPRLAWAGLRVNVVDQEFDDLRVILQGADCLRADAPLYSCGDPPYNYPSALARLAAAVHLGPGDTVVLGWLLVLLTLSVLLAMLGACAPELAGLCALAAVSPPVLLGLCRANSDLLIFLLLATALLSSRWAAPLIGLAATLKLYPILAAAALRSRRALLALGLGFAAYLALIHQELPAIAAATPQFHSVGMFGVRCLPERAAATLSLVTQEVHNSLARRHWIDAPVLSVQAVPSPIVERLGLLLWLAGLAALYLRARRHARALEPIPGWEFRFFTAGTALCAGTFLIAKSWDYRLIFLLCLLPYLGRLFAVARPLALEMAVLLTAALWLTTLPVASDLGLDELALGALLASALALVRPAFVKPR